MQRPSNAGILREWTPGGRSHCAPPPAAAALRTRGPGGGRRGPRGPLVGVWVGGLGGVPPPGSAPDGSCARRNIFAYVHDATILSASVTPAIPPRLHATAGKSFRTSNRSWR